MAVPDILTNYIAKNYKRLLVCVVPPPEETEPSSIPARTPSVPTSARPAPPHFETAATDAAPTPEATAELSPRPSVEAADAGRWRRRRSSARPRSLRAWRTRGRQERTANFVYVRDGDEFVREDPLRGCVSSRSVGPRSSGDFVVMGCMQV